MSNPSTVFPRRRVCVLLGGPHEPVPPPVPQDRGAAAGLASAAGVAGAANH